MIRLTAIYKERSSGRWDGYIKEAPHICVTQAEDLATAKEFLPIITAEEVQLMWKIRTRWSINKEEVYEFFRSDQY